MVIRVGHGCPRITRRRGMSGVSGMSVVVRVFDGRPGVAVDRGAQRRADVREGERQDHERGGDDPVHGERR